MIYYVIPLGNFSYVLCGQFIWILNIFYLHVCLHSVTFEFGGRQTESYKQHYIIMLIYINCSSRNKLKIVNDFLPRNKRFYFYIRNDTNNNDDW